MRKPCITKLALDTGNEEHLGGWEGYIWDWFVEKPHDNPLRQNNKKMFVSVKYKNKLKNVKIKLGNKYLRIVVV